MRCARRCCEIAMSLLMRSDLTLMTPLRRRASDVLTLNCGEVESTNFPTLTRKS